MLRPGLAAALLMAAVVPARATDPPWPDPWHPAVETAAERAVARLGAKRALDIRPRVLRIAGVAQGVAGTGSGIVATVQEVQQAMQALGAQESDLEVRVDLPADVLFDFDKADIRADASEALTRLATLIHAYPDGRVDIEGHTDSQGNDAYNQRLSERRAASVQRWLVERQGIAAARLAPRGAGEKQPVADNSTEAGRQKNRRVQVVIQKSR